MSRDNRHATLDILNTQIAEGRTPSAADLITASIETHSTVHAPWSDGLACVLADYAADGGDTVRNGQVIECWGAVDGAEWRVHLDLS